MNVPNQAIIVGCNESFKQVWKKNNLEHSFLTYFGFASLAGMISSVLTMPLDNIRTRMNTQCDLKLKTEPPKPKTQQDKKLIINQTRSITKQLSRGLSAKEDPCTDVVCEKCVNGNEVKYRGSLRTLRLVVATEGLQGLFKGLVPRTASQSFSTAVAWSTYEMMKKLLIKGKEVK